MKITQLGTGADGTRSFEIRANELSYRALLRSIRKIAGAIVTDAAHDPMNDNARVSIRYKGVTIDIETPFSDYIISCTSSSAVFDEFISKLGGYTVKWWEHFF
jgi:hypothetical protein